MAEPFGNSVGNNVESLEARYRHLDDRVGRMGQEVAGISATLSNFGHTLEAINKRVNEPQRTQWASIIAACAFVASLGYSALSPVQASLEKQTEKLDAVITRQREVSGLMGEFTARLQADDARHEHVSKSIEKLAERSYDIQGRVAADDARVDALVERIRDVDMAGSRKWARKD